MVSKLIEKTIKSELIFKGRVISLRVDQVLLPNNSFGYREIIMHNGGVAILPLIGPDKCILIKQYRHAYNDIILEIPAGKLEIMEDPLQAAQRELSEEIGYKCSDLSFLGQMYPSVGYTNEVIHLYVAENLQIDKQKLDEDEFLEVVEIKIKDAYEMVLNNEIKDAKTSLAILLYWSGLNVKSDGSK